MKRDLYIATCQFPVSANIRKNELYILKQLKESKEKGVDIAHFSESSLSGYAGIDFFGYESRDEHLLAESLEKIRETTAELKIWAIVGSHYFSNQIEKPFNCLWLINDEGQILKRYDKRLLFGAPEEGEHEFYVAGNSIVQFIIKGIKCGLLICHEWRYPELYREQKMEGTELIFQSSYDVYKDTATYQTEGKELGNLVVGTIQGNAANNYLWISASNTSKKESSFASFIARPDGRIHQRLKRNVTGVLISKIDFNQQFTDPSGPWRKRAYQGILNNAQVENQG